MDKLFKTAEEVKQASEYYLIDLMYELGTRVWEVNKLSKDTKREYKKTIELVREEMYKRMMDKYS